MTVEFDAELQAVPTRDAASVVLLRDGIDGLELFFVQRRAEARFMGGAYVFPGGKLDDEDTRADLPCDLDADVAALRLGETDAVRARGLFVAALRECFEEAGVLLTVEPLDPEAMAVLRAAHSQSGARFCERLQSASLRLRASALVPLVRWITPRGETKRFDARFFLAAAPPDAAASHDEGETVANLWLSPQRAIDAALERRILLVPPTYRTVQGLTRAATVAEALALATLPVPVLEPRVAFGDSGEIHILLPDDPDYPRADAPLGVSTTVRSDQWATRFLYADGSWFPGRRAA